MKFLIVLMMSLSLNAWALERVPLMKGKVYVPEGYDTNDLVEVFISGSLPDTCHRNPTYEIIRTGRSFKIHLYAHYVPVPEGCREISIPYFETISLGLLEEGAYQITVKAQNRPEVSHFKVKQARGQLQDDFSYGNVMNILEDPDDRTIELIGTNPMDCLKFEKLSEEIQDSVIVLRPQFVEVGECKEMPTHFNLKYKVPYLPNHPKGLMIHVRVMGGRSLNHLYHNLL